MSTALAAPAATREASVLAARSLLMQAGLLLRARPTHPHSWPNVAIGPLCFLPRPDSHSVSCLEFGCQPAEEHWAPVPALHHGSAASRWRLLASAPISHSGLCIPASAFLTKRNASINCTQLVLPSFTFLALLAALRTAVVPYARTIQFCFQAKPATFLRLTRAPFFPACLPPLPLRIIRPFLPSTLSALLLLAYV